MLLVFFILIILLLTLRFEINIKANFKIKDKNEVDNEFIEIKVYILEYMKIMQFKLNKDKLNKINNNAKLKNIDKKQILKNIKFKKQDLNILKVLKIKKLDFILKIGLDELMATIYLIPILSTFLSIIYSKFVKKGYYKLIPVYNENIIKLNFDCIISIKLIHIISIIWKIIRKRDEKNERTSNRRAYAYSNE